MSDDDMIEYRQYTSDDSDSDSDSNSDSNFDSEEDNYKAKGKGKKGFQKNSRGQERTEVSHEYTVDLEDVKIEEEETESKPQFPTYSSHTFIKNSLRRHDKFSQLKKQKKIAKKELRKLREKESRMLGKPLKKKKPVTIEDKREVDPTATGFVEDDLAIEEASDDYAKYYSKSYEPKILLTTSNNIHGRTVKFVRELALIIPNAVTLWRNKSTIRKIVDNAPAKGFTDILVVNEDRRVPTGLLLIHLPKGPTALFRLSNVKLCRDIKRNSSDITGHRPELVLNNFKTRLGRMMARMFGALFHYDPEFRGRSVCTFHNQRDYIFFRHHRYQFRGTEKANLKELGPRFTLRLQWLQNGAFEGDYEWTFRPREMGKSRTKFSL